MAPLYAAGHRVCERDGRGSSVMECLVEISVCDLDASPFCFYANSIGLSVTEVES